MPAGQQGGLDAARGTLARCAGLAIKSIGSRISVPAGPLPTAGSFCTCEGGWGVITTVMSALMSALHECTAETHHVGIPGIPGTPRLSIRLYETVDTLYSTLHADYARRAHRTVATH